MYPDTERYLKGWVLPWGIAVAVALTVGYALTHHTPMPPEARVQANEIELSDLESGDIFVTKENGVERANVVIGNISVPGPGLMHGLMYRSGLNDDSIVEAKKESISEIAKRFVCTAKYSRVGGHDTSYEHWAAVFTTQGLVQAKTAEK